MSRTSKKLKFYITNPSLWLTFEEQIKDGHVNNHFGDIFVPMCRIDSFINGNGQKLTYDRFVALFLLLGTKN